MSEGWLCPRCGKINAPFVTQCNCMKEQSRITCESIRLNLKDLDYFTSEWNKVSDSSFGIEIDKDGCSRQTDCIFGNKEK